jgi:Riboflavin kinase
VLHRIVWFRGWGLVLQDDVRRCARKAARVVFSPCGVQERTAEPWLLHEFEEDFYGQELRLVVCAYLRPEANFSSMQDLIKRIHQDAADAREALADPKLAKYAEDGFLRPAGADGGLQQG